MIIHRIFNHIFYEELQELYNKECQTFNPFYELDRISVMCQNLLLLRELNHGHFQIVNFQALNHFNFVNK